MCILSNFVNTREWLIMWEKNMIVLQWKNFFRTPIFKEKKQFSKLNLCKSDASIISMIKIIKVIYSFNILSLRTQLKNSKKNISLLLPSISKRHVEIWILFFCMWNYDVVLFGQARLADLYIHSSCDSTPSHRFIIDWQCGHTPFILYEKRGLRSVYVGNICNYDGIFWW